MVTLNFNYVNSIACKYRGRIANEIHNIAEMEISKKGVILIEYQKIQKMLEVKGREEVSETANNFISATKLQPDIIMQRIS